MNFAVCAVGGQRSCLPGAVRQKQEQHTGSDPEEHVPVRLFSDLAEAHHLDIEPLGAIQIGHVEHGFQDPGDAGRLGVVAGARPPSQPRT